MWWLSHLCSSLQLFAKTSKWVCLQPVEFSHGPIDFVQRGSEVHSWLIRLWSRITHCAVYDRKLCSRTVATSILGRQYLHLVAEHQHLPLNQDQHLPSNQHLVAGMLVQPAQPRLQYHFQGVGAHRKGVVSSASGWTPGRVTCRVS